MHLKGGKINFLQNPTSKTHLFLLILLLIFIDEKLHKARRRYFCECIHLFDRLLLVMTIEENIFMVVSYQGTFCELA